MKNIFFTNISASKKLKHILSIFSIYSRNARISVYFTFRSFLIVSRTGEPRSYTSKINFFHHYLPTAFSLSIVMESWSDHGELRNLPSTQVPPTPPQEKVESFIFFFPVVLAILSFHSWSGFKFKHPILHMSRSQETNCFKILSQKFWVTLKIYSPKYVCVYIHTHI